MSTWIQTCVYVTMFDIDEVNIIYKPAMYQTIAMSLTNVMYPPSYIVLVLCTETMVCVCRGESVFCVAAVSGDKISKAVSLISIIIMPDRYVDEALGQVLYTTTISLVPS